MALDPPLVHAACGLGHHLYGRTSGVQSKEDIRSMEYAHHSGGIRLEKMLAVPRSR